VRAGPAVAAGNTKSRPASSAAWKATHTGGSKDKRGRKKCVCVCARERRRESKTCPFMGSLPRTRRATS
jgi:hypothetical protein